MIIIPGINCASNDCVAARFSEAKAMLENVSSENRWVHIDIAGDSFTESHQTITDPEVLNSLERGDIKIELHVMINSPEEVIEPWLNAGIARLILHAESSYDSEAVQKMCKEKGVAFMVALRPETEVEDVSEKLEGVTEVQLLAVSPGKSGQAFNRGIIKKIEDLVKKDQYQVIEVDGGVTKEVAVECKNAGATQVAMTSELFSAENQTENFKEITEALKI